MPPKRSSDKKNTFPAEETALPKDGSCPFLNRGSRCMIYQAHPRKSLQSFIHKLENMDYQLKGNGPSLRPDFMTRLSKSEGRGK